MVVFGVDVQFPSEKTFQQLVDSEVCENVQLRDILPPLQAVLWKAHDSYCTLQLVTRLEEFLSLRFDRARVFLTFPVKLLSCMGSPLLSSVDNGRSTC